MDEGAETAVESTGAADYEDFQDARGEKVDQIRQARGATKSKGVHAVRARTEPRDHWRGVVHRAGVRRRIYQRVARAVREIHLLARARDAERSERFRSRERAQSHRSRTG